MIFALLGASGTGKTTLGGYLDEAGIEEIISYTTREPREGESEGDPYYFVDEDEFEELDKIEEVEYSGNRYAFAEEEFDKKLVENDFVYLIADRNGVEQIQELYGEDNVTVIYLVSTVEELRGRMKERGDDLDKIDERIEHAIKTDEIVGNYDIADYIIRSKDGMIREMVYQIGNIVKSEILKILDKQMDEETKSIIETP